MVGAPYDWRRSPGKFCLTILLCPYLAELTGYYSMLRTQIVTLYKYNQNQKVVVIGHSMGNPIMNYCEYLIKIFLLFSL